MATADQIARYLAQLQAGRTITVTTPAVRKAKAHAQKVANAAHALDFETVAALLDAVPPDSASVALLVHVASLGASNHQRKAAQAKNAGARAYVLAEWAARPDVLVSKAEWSRRCAVVVLRMFNTKISADTIARDWLPKSDGLAEGHPKGAKAWTGRYHLPRET